MAIPFESFRKDIKNSLEHMKKIIFTITLFVLGFTYVSAQEPVQLIKTDSDSGSSLQFMNHKSFDVSKIERFTSRLENYYQTVSSIHYNADENTFVIDFLTADIADAELRDILTHFDVYEFTIIQQ
jgi:hypothetical protein